MCDAISTPDSETTAPDDAVGAGNELTVPAHTCAQDRASQIRETAAAAFLYTTMASFFTNVAAPAYRAFRDRLIADCGSPDDPIEVMLIEQLMLAHFNTGRLHYRSATASGLDEARAYATAAVNLASEFRRGALALKAYREPARIAEAAPIPKDVSEDNDVPRAKAVRRRTGS